MILDILYLIDFIVFTVDSVTIWTYWIPSISLNATIIFFIPDILIF